MLLVDSRKAVIALLAFVTATPLAAHHGAAAYERASTVTLTGTVESFEWANPHALIRLRVESEDGETWTAETAGLVILARAGWSRDSLKPGDRCTVMGYAARNGTPSMILRAVVLADGRELTNYVP